MDIPKNKYDLKTGQRWKRCWSKNQHAYEK